MTSPTDAPLSNSPFIFPNNAAACEPPAGKCTLYQNGQLYLHYNYAGSLEMVAEFHNQRPDNADTTPGGVNTANATITGYRYKFSSVPPVALSSFTWPYLTTPIAAGGSSTLWVPVLPPPTVVELRAAPAYTGFVNVEITPRGHFGDGTTFEAGSFTVPVLVTPDPPLPSICASGKEPFFCPNEFQTHSSSCEASDTFAILGSVSGLVGDGLVLRSLGIADLTVSAGSGVFLFGDRVADGYAYNITIVTQPTGQNCVVTNGSGVVAGADPSGIAITCT